jgi:hypothetical protein
MYQTGLSTLEEHRDRQESVTTGKPGISEGRWVTWYPLAERDEVSWGCV